MTIHSHTWHPLGTVAVINGRPSFPTVAVFTAKPTVPTKVPGNYRLTFNNGYIYIGKTKDLQSRFGNYRTPTSGTEQEHVLRYILVDAGGAMLEIIPESELPKGSTRHAVEREELNAAIKAGLNLLNTGGRGRGHYLMFKVIYHEAALKKARAELERWNLNALP